MPRYFIDTDNGDTYVRDETGHEMPDHKAARRLALCSLPEMADDKMPDGDQRTFKALVRDEGGTVIYIATLELRGEWLVTI